MTDSINKSSLAAHSTDNILNCKSENGVEALDTFSEPKCPKSSKTCEESKENNKAKKCRPSDSVISSNIDSDVSSSGSSGITKIETLDFTASQDAFDDLASIVGISMGADSTVDLDDWIENTAQNIKPLMGGDNGMEASQSSNGGAMTQLALQNAISRHHGSNSTGCPINGPQTPNTQSYLHLSGVSSPSSQINCGSTGILSSASTLQSLLQGNLLPGPPPQNKSTTQLTRDSHTPPSYSILHSRLTHGANPPTLLGNAAVVKVDSTFDLLKITSDTSSNNNNNTIFSSSGAYGDSLPHSTQNGGNSHSSLGHVSTSESDQSLHRRLGELGNLAKLKAKNKMRQKIESGIHSAAAVAAVSQGATGISDQGKKMMHHCQICNRGFLNKSNIKVHMRTHTGEKPFPCKHCSKTFRQKAHLLKHMSIHKRISRD